MTDEDNGAAVIAWVFVGGMLWAVGLSIWWLARCQ